MTPNPQPTRYEEIRAQECEWCAKGISIVMSLADRPMHYTSWNARGYDCTAPTKDQFIKRQAKQIEGLRKASQKVVQFERDYGLLPNEQVASQDELEAAIAALDAALKEET